MKKILIIIGLLSIAFALTTTYKSHDNKEIEIIQKGVDDNGKEFLRYRYKDRRYFENEETTSIRFIAENYLYVDAYSSDKESYKMHIVLDSGYYKENYNIDMTSADTLKLSITNQNGISLVEDEYEIRKNNYYTDMLNPDFDKMILVEDCEDFLNDKDTYNISIKVNDKTLVLAENI